MPEHDDLDLTGLERVAPAVDLDAATAGFGAVRRRRRLRRRAVVGGCAALVAVGAVGLGLAVARDGDAHLREYVDTGPTTTAVPPGPVSVERDGLRLTLDAPREATVGTRVWATVTLTNVGDETVRAGRVGGCDDQVTAGIESEGADQHVGPTYVPEGTDPQDMAQDQRGMLPRYLGPAVEWNADRSLLGYVLGPQADPVMWEGRDVGVTDQACLAMYTPPAEIEPGAQVRERLAIDLRWGTAAPGGSYQVVAVGGSVVDANGSDGSWPPNNLTVSAPIAIADDPARVDSRDAALDALGDAPTLQEWADHTADIDAVPGFRQRWFANLSWWDGAWEAWIKPMAGNGHQTDSLRIRWDPARGQVVDVRTVFWNWPPSDDPDAPTRTDFPPGDDGVDDVRYHLD